MSSNILTNDICELLISLRMKQQVDALLRNAKQNNPDAKEIKLSGTTKTIVEENLRKAVSAGYISINDVLKAVTEYEESKPHHRLYYKIEEQKAIESLNDPEYVREQLFGIKIQPDNFPDLKAEPIGEEWADFRILLKGWIAKMYRGGDRWVLNQEECKEESDRRVKVWRKEYTREVWCITWDKVNQLLVLQFPPNDVKSDYEDTYKGIRNIASKVVTIGLLDPFPLTKGVISLVNEYPRIKDQIRIIVADLGSDKQGHALLATQNDTEHLVDDKDLAAAIKLFSEAKEATIIWLPTKSTDSIKEETRTVIGKRAINNVHFTALSNPKTLEYICNELIRRSITAE